MLVYILVAAGAIILLYYHLKEPSWAKTIPGMPCWPVIGNMFQIESHKPQVTFQNWSKKLGAVFKIRLFGQTQIVVNDYESVYEILVKRSNDFAGRTSMYRSREFTDNNSDIAFQDFCPKFVFMKKLFMAGVRLGQGNNGDIEKAALKCATDLIDKFKKLNGKPTNIKTDLRLAILKAIVILGFGAEFADNEDCLMQLSVLEETILRAVSFAGAGVVIDFIPWIRIFGGSVVKDLERCNDVKRTVLAKIIAEIRKRRASGKPDACILDPILTEYDKQVKNNSPGILKEENIQMSGFDIIVAGLVTTSNLLLHVVNLMLHHPDVLKRAQAEADAVAGPDRPVLLEDRAHMPYCQAILLESLRHFSHVPLGIPHKTTQDTYVGGHFIPKGIQVIANIWAVHHEDSFWEAPYEFRPDRYLDVNGELVGPEHQNRKRLLSFGAGRRVCAGEILALIRAFIFFANLVKSFDISPPADGKLVTCDPRSREFLLGAATQPPAYLVRFLPRQKSVHPSTPYEL